MKVNPIGINRKKISWLLEQDIDVKLEAVNHHMEITRMLINDIMQDEVERYAGARYHHCKPHSGQFSRWGYNRGSVKIGQERLPVDVPRIRDNHSKKSKNLESYQRLRKLDAIDDHLLKAVLCGLSVRDYEPVIRTLLDSFGLSHSTVSKEFVKQSSERLKAFEQRDLSEYDFISLFIDGKHLAKEQMMIVLGVTLQGDKIPIGFIQTASENSATIKDLLEQLINRGLCFDQGLLCVIDGSKGIYKAIKEVFREYAVIQRCQWHKRENVLKYLPDDKADHYRRRLNRAYRCESYLEAKTTIEAILNDLQVDNMSAAGSLREGLEDTLTLHRLGISEEFSRSFATTNCIENLNSQIGKYLKKVKNWKTSNQRFRWTASALTEIEQKMRKVNNHKNLYKMREAIQKEVSKQKKSIHNVA